MPFERSKRSTSTSRGSADLNKSCKLEDSVLDRTCRVALTPETRFRAVDDEAVVLNQTTAEVLVVSAVGCRVLELIRDDGGVERVLDRLLAEYDVEKPVLERDVLAFLAEMVDAGTLSVADGDGAP